MKKFSLLILFLVAMTSVHSQKYMFVFLNKKDNPELPKEQLDKLMEGHMANMGRLVKEGKLIAAGPFEGGGGIFIFRADNRAQVEEYISMDPGVQAKRWNIEILNYTPRIGKVCLAPEPYQMVNYSFVRYTVMVAKDTFSEIAEGLRQHEQYMKKLSANTSIIQEATFGDEEGSILIVNGELSNELIDQDPALTKGALTSEIKKLYIAKGSFCEK